VVGVVDLAFHRVAASRCWSKVGDTSAAAEAFRWDFADWAVESAQLTMLDAIHARAYADQLAKATDNA
jgi:hypothetical protein